MNSDCYFAMGKSHMICEDYAYSGVNANGNQVAVVSDGCSASPDTDFGSRFLVRSSVICGANTKYNSIQTFGDELVRGTIWCASQAHKNLRLSSQCLDATLLYLEIRDDNVVVVTAGDGVVFAIKHDGSLEYWETEYPSGAPFYPSYLLDEPRFDGYVAHCGVKSVFKRMVEVDGSLLEMENVIMHNMVNHFTLPIDEYKFIGVTSDGISTFDMSTYEALKQLTAYKNTKGEFVKRRMRKFLKQCAKNNVSPSDDISMAVVHFGE
jgi:hypothetical protein